MRVFPIPLLSHVRGLVRRAPCSRMYAVPALACTNSTISHSDQSKEGNFDVQSLELNQVGVLRELTTMRDDPYLALSFLNRIEGDGALPSVQAYAAVIRIVCSWSLDEKLDNLFVGLIRKGEEGCGFSVFDLLNAVGEAEEDEMISFLLLSRVSSALVKAYAKVELFDEAIYLFWEIQQLGWEADAESYVVVVQALYRKGDREGVKKFLRKLLSRETRKPCVFYMDFVGGLCVNQMSLVAYSLLRDANILVDESDLAAAYSKVVRSLCSEMKLEEAESALLDMEKCGIDPDVCVYSAIIEGHRKNMSFSEALRFVKDKEAQLGKRIINPVIASSILRCFCQMGKFSKAFDQFIRFRNQDTTLDRFCYNIAFDALIKLGKVDKAIELFREMTDEKGIAPDVVNYTTLIDGCCQQGRCEQAIDLIIEMDNKGKPPDIVTYNVLAGGLARNSVNAFDILKLMEARGVKPTSITHNMVIQGLIVAGKINEAEAFYQSLEEHKSGGNVAGIVKGYCEAGRLDEAFERLIRVDCPLPKNVYFTLFTSLCAKENHIDKAQEILERMWELGVEPGKSMYGKLIGAWCRVDAVEKAQRFLKVLEDREIVPDLFTYTIMIKTCCRLNKLKQADALFRDMKRRGIKPDVVTYTVLAKNNPKIDKDMKACGVEPDVFYYTTMINTYYRLNKEKKACAVVQEMKRGGIDLDVATYTVLINSYHRLNYQQKALAVIQEMRRGGIEPDVVTYTALINNYYLLNNQQKVRALFQEMKRRGILPDVVTYTVSLNHNPEFMKSEMKAIGIKRDVHYYTVMIHHKCKIGEPEEAFRIFQEMIGSGVKADFVSFKVLVAGFLRKGYVLKPGEFLQMMREYGIEPTEALKKTLYPTPRDVYLDKDPRSLYRKTQVRYRLLTTENRVHC